MSYSRSSPPVLLAVRDLHEEIRAGFGRSTFAVRTLDGVSLVVRAGELVVLRGAVACGAASLVALLTGTRPLRSGVRVVANGVQIRRGCIGPDALDALMSGWSATPSLPIRAPVRETPVVHVFHVRPFASSGRRSIMAGAEQEQWRAWAMTLRSQGGSVIVHVPVTGSSALRPPVRRYGMHPRTSQAPVVHEARMGDADIPRDSIGGVRVLTLAAGRIVSADKGPIDPLHSQ